MVASPGLAQAPGAASGGEFDDSHFHLTNYVQEGVDVRAFLKIMGTRVGRSTLFGIPLQQMWSYANSGEFAPTYYLQSDAPLYYYSFTDAYVAMTYRSLTPEQRARFDIEVWPGDVHGTLNVPVQRRVLDRALEWIGQFHPQAAADAASGGPAAGGR